MKALKHTKILMVRDMDGENANFEDKTLDYGDQSINYKMGKKIKLQDPP